MWKAILSGFVNILEACRHHGTRHLLYASSSSVYGGVTKMPFSVHQNVDHPLSVYAATKKSNELLAHAYSHLFRLPTTGLRFFTVYGPWGRPDMALFIFTRAILAGKPIQIFNYGRMERDFTYIDDIVDGVFRLTDLPPQPDANWNGDAPDPGRSSAPYRLYNIGNSQPVPLMQLIAVLENCLGIEAKKEFLPMQPGDVPATYADIDDWRARSVLQPRTASKRAWRNSLPGTRNTTSADGLGRIRSHQEGDRLPDRQNRPSAIAAVLWAVFSLPSGVAASSPVCPAGAAPDAGQSNAEKRA